MLVNNTHLTRVLEPTTDCIYAVLNQGWTNCIILEHPFMLPKEMREYQGYGTIHIMHSFTAANNLDLLS